MSSLGTLSSVRLLRNPLVLLTAFLLAFWAAYESAQAILADDPSSLIYAVLLSIACAVVIAILNDWRRGVYLFVAWLLFEDLFRKYLGNNMAIYFAKDFLVMVLYLSFFRTQRAKRLERLRIPFRLPLLLFIWFGVIQMFNPASTSIFYGILGVKVDFLYIPLILVGYSFVRSDQDLRRFLSFSCVLVMIVAGLGLVQSIIGPTFLNPSHLQEDIRELSTTYRVAPISGLAAYRPNSVFVSGGRYADFLILSWTVSLGYGGYLLLRSRQGRSLAFAAIGVTAAASLMSASRGVFMWEIGIALVSVLGFVWGAPWRQGEVIRVLRAIVRTTIFVLVGVVLLLMFFPNELGSRVAIYSETLMPDSPASELVHRTQTYPMQQLYYAFDHPRWPYGYGIGTTTLGTQYVVKLMHAAPMRIGVESGIGNLIVELGIMGPVLWLLLGIGVVISTWRVLKKLKGTPWFPLAFAIALYAFLLFFPIEFVSSAAYQDFILNSNLWLLLGILYRLYLFPDRIQKNAQEVSHIKS
jgi:hypothetical protein